MFLLNSLSQSFSSVKFFQKLPKKTEFQKGFKSPFRRDSLYFFTKNLILSQLIANIIICIS